MATIKDVARHAGVSVTTISNFLNNKKNVKDDTRLQIVEAIKVTGYRFNPLAASLKRKATGLKTIGIISMVNEGPFFQELFFELESAAYNSGYAVLSCFQREENADLETHIELMYGRVDGLILISLHRDKVKEVIRNIHAVPIVAMAFDTGEVTTLCGSTHLDIKDELGGYIGGRFLLSKGHKRIACVSGINNQDNTNDRIAGLSKAFKEFNLDENDLNVIEGDFSYQSGVNAMYKLFSSPPLPTAIVCHNDMMAIGVQNACVELGIKVPDDISVIGYDDIQLASISSPPLTTIRLPLDELANQAIESINSKISNKTSSTDSFISITPSLVVRGSVR
jgi:LacI family transcriptional regulator